MTDTHTHTHTHTHAHTHRERQRHRQREKQAPYRETDMGLDPGAPGSRPGPNADTQPLNHHGCPPCIFLYMTFPYPTFSLHGGKKNKTRFFSVCSFSPSEKFMFLCLLSIFLIMPFCCLCVSVVFIPEPLPHKPYYFSHIPGRS